MESYFYTDLNVSFGGLTKRIEQYANAHQISIYMLRMPKNELEEYEHYNCFLLLSAGYKAAMINYSEQEVTFRNYCDDVEESVSYLFTKYEYRKELGRFRSFFEPLKEIISDIHELNDLNEFFGKIKLMDLKQKRYSNILVSLCTGSINDISRIKGSLPETLLDRVKQKIQLFDADQTRFIYQHLDQKRVKIQGLSGTGKTELLLHKLKELYSKKDTHKIFVTCHNKILADALHSKIPKFFNFMKVSQQIEWEEQLWCTNAWGRYGDENSGFYRYLCSFYDLIYYRYNRFTSFDDVCRIAVSEIKKKKREREFQYAFDYVLVDECQDFPESFFELCDLVTEKQVYIAGDIFQSIFETHELADYSADYFLTKCYRTDPKTLMFAHALGLGLFEEKKLRWLKEADWQACGYTYSEKNGLIKLSREPVRRFLDIDEKYKSVEISSFNVDDVAVKVLAIINKIKNECEDVTMNDICIILLDDNDYTYTWANLIENKINVELGWTINKAYESKHTIKDTLLISNRNNVKGLEYPFVICVTKGLVGSAHYRNSIYTMLTRSFLKSYLLISDNQLSNCKVLEKKFEEIDSTDCLVLRKPSDKELREIETSFKRMTKRKPLADEIRDYLIERKIPDAQIEKLVSSALNLGWQELSSEQLRKNIDSLISLSNL